MLCLPRRFLSRCSELLRTELAQAYFQTLYPKLEAVRKGGDSSWSNSSSCLPRLETVASLATAYYDKLDMLKQLNTLAKDGSDCEIQEIAKEDSEQLVAELDRIAGDLTDALLPTTEFDTLNNCQLEITPGVGGIEASLFASELTHMYHSYADYRKWNWTPFQIDVAPSGGIRCAVVFVRGSGVFRTLRNEAGVHRVQRFPVTDKTRIHTSTSVVAVLPEPEKVEACVTADDVRVETMRASGPGGQNVNQRATAVRLTHRETGISVHCMDERTQYSNMEVGTKARAEKVRTYNFKDDQVTDHRLGRAWQNVMNVMKGGSVLHEIIDALDEASKTQHLEELMRAKGSEVKFASCNV